MRAFLLPVVVTDSPKRRASYAVGHDAVHDVFGRQVLIPAGFEFDGASIPPLLWPVIGSPFDPRLIGAALIHDWLYSTHLTDRITADRAFRAQLIADGAGDWRAQAMYGAVRLAGSASWGDSDEDVAYMAYLRERIVAGGRYLSDYGL